ncbi:MAG: response regulator transcription factor [Victivallales bacterium]|nr:response regulator transcription factor [Victivallales bacterium]
MSRKIKILVAEDDNNIREGLTDALEFEGYEVFSAADGSKALKAYAQLHPDLILLDVMMPRKNGYEVCREIRRGNRDIPIIMLTAKSEEIDKVLGLELGSDDYITKPYSLRELTARIAAVLRRSRRKKGNDKTEYHGGELKFGKVKVYLKRLIATTPNGEVELSAREIELLKYFMLHAGTVLNRDDILEKVWGMNYHGFSRTLDQHIVQLRKKIEPDPKKPSHIKTVYGIGYRFILD